MRLLVVTQAVDLDDPILGFFHAWIVELAKRVENVEVICLREGVHNLPQNVHVHSLGKESGGSRIVYLARFGYYIWTLRSRYDRVLVHMNPEYVILARLDWWVTRKKVALWYNHPRKDWRLMLAARLADKIFYTSPYAATASYRHAVRMPAGIDTTLFAPQSVPRNRHALYMQGRIMRSKRVDAALAALRLLRQARVNATLTLVGPEDRFYGEDLRQAFSDLIDLRVVAFAGARPNRETPALYSGHGASINLAASGHYDKSVLESMACETPVVLSSKAFAGLVPDEWIVPEGDPVALAATITRMLELSDAEYRALGEHERQTVIQGESLTALMDKLVPNL